MELFREQFKGYAKYDVERFIDGLEKENQDLKERFKHSQETIQELKNQLRRFQEREGFISEVLVDAKVLSQNLLAGTKESAEEEARNIIQDAEERLARAENSLRRIAQLERTFSSYEDTLKKELRIIFEDYLNRSENLNFERSRAKQEEIAEEMAQIKSDLSVSKAIVSFPKEQFLKPREKETIPIYSLD